MRENGTQLIKVKVLVSERQLYRLFILKTLLLLHILINGSEGIKLFLKHNRFLLEMVFFV